MRDPLRQFPLPSLSPTASVRFDSGLYAGHYLLMRVLDPSIRRGTDEADRFHDACGVIVGEMQTRAMVVRGWDRPGSLFPESRTYEPNGGDFQYEFWWLSQDISVCTTEETWDIDALVAAVDLEWLGTAIKARMEESLKT